MGLLGTPEEVKIIAFTILIEIRTHAVPSRGRCRCVRICTPEDDLFDWGQGSTKRNPIKIAIDASGALGKVISMVCARRESKPDRIGVLVITAAAVIGDQPYEPTDTSINQS